MKLSILTPTYNRADLLKRLYESIKKNQIETLEIEWLIMDDGSIDETKQVVEEFQKENIVDITYFYQENRGKMSAINELVPKAKGDLIVECDSDDYFEKHAFATIQKTAKDLEDDIYAVCYLKYDSNRCNMGKLFSKEKTTMFDLYFKEGEDGEKALVFNASIRKQYRYELENGEKFVTEARMFHKMDLKYAIKCVNEPIMICAYQEGGYTKNIIEIFKKNPYGYFEYFKEMLDMDLREVHLKKKLYIMKHYILFAVLTNKSLKETLSFIKEIKTKIEIAILFLPGKWITNRKFR